MAAAAEPTTSVTEKKKDDSFMVSSLGRQCDSKKETMPVYSMGTGNRDTCRLKVYHGPKHEKKKGGLVSPGPVYSVPSTVGDAPRFGFGSEEQRKHSKAKYPDSSVDLTCSVVDSQVVKFHGTKGVHFGTESRLNSKNAEIVRVHPASALGMESPGALEYSPEETLTTKVPPEYSFGPKVQGDISGAKIKGRLTLPLTSTPRHVGPGSHMQPSGLGSQPCSARGSAPSWGFGSSERSSSVRKDQKHLIDTCADFSSLGQQVVSSARSAPKFGFGTSTREHTARTQIITTALDKGPIAQLPAQKFHLDLPKPERVNRHGM